MAAALAITMLVNPIVSLVLQKLLTNAWKKLAIKLKVDTVRLEMRLTIIISILNQESVAAAAADTALAEWLNKLKDAAYDADDIVNLCHAEALRRQMMERESIKSKVTDFISPGTNKFEFSRRMGKKIKEVTKTLDEIEKRIPLLLLSKGSPSTETPIYQGRETFLAVPKHPIYGRDEDKQKIVKYLTDDEKGEKLSVVSIVGLGGIGKTTLAQLVCEDKSIREKFGQPVWVWVSAHEFSVVEILGKIIRCITGSPFHHKEIEPMRRHLEILLGGKKFLLVLDDAWSEDAQEWEALTSVLGVGMEGSKILVTSRCLQVARKMASTFTHELEGLSVADCLKLFRLKNSCLDQREGASAFENIEMEIIRKCGGLPSAVKAMGSLVETKTRVSEWSHVQKTEMWRLTGEIKRVMDELLLSYQHMPSHLKSCFMYFSLFPKCYKFDKEKLIRLWIAEGFVPSLDDSGDKGTGHSYFDSFLWRYFFQDVEQRYQNQVVSFKMHEAVQNLACSVAGDEFLFAAGNESLSVGDGDDLTTRNTTKNCMYRYLSLICKSLSLDSLKNSSFEINKVRSLISLTTDSNKRCNLGKNTWDMLLNLKLLRVLDLSSTDILELPDGIRNLQVLRLLNLSNTDIRTLPDSITTLHYLLTLNLAYCCQLQELPSGVSNMSNLRHLDVYGCDSLTHMPDHIGRLSKLRALTMFIVGEKDGHTIKELQDLNLIRGRLQIKDLQNLNGKMEAEAASLWEKENVQQLELHWKGNCESAEDVFEGLRPCQDLEELKISGYMGIRFPSWMSAGSQTRFQRVRELSIINCKVSALSSLSNGMQFFSSLEKLKISSCEELICLPNSIIQHRNLSLRILDISENKNLKSLCEREEQEAPVFFTSLHSLMLGKCVSLVKLPKWLDRLTSLESLDLSDCSKLVGLRQLKALDQISVTLCRDLAKRYAKETGESWNMAPVPVPDETQQGGEQEMGNSRRRKGSVSNFLKHLGLTKCGWQRSA